MKSLADSTRLEDLKTAWSQNLGLPRCKNLTRFSLFVSFCFAVRYCLKCFCFLCFTSSVSFTGSYTEVKPLFALYFLCTNRKQTRLFLLRHLCFKACFPSSIRDFLLQFASDFLFWRRRYFYKHICSILTTKTDLNMQTVICISFHLEGPLLAGYFDPETWSFCGSDLVSNFSSFHVKISLL